MNKKHGFIFIFLFSFSQFACNDREVLYSGLNDKVMGVDQIVLFDDATFYLETGIGGNTGSFSIQKDTLHLKYNRSNKGPSFLIMRAQYFIGELNGKKIKIKRDK